MANPFAQEDWDPFGDLPAASKPQTPDLTRRTSDHTAFRPARPAPTPPSANPFSGLGSSSAQSDDPFAFLTAQHAPTASTSGPADPAPPRYEAATATPAPPSYDRAVDLPPPPAYDAAAWMPPPPSYEAVVGAAPAGYPAVAQQPARPAPLAPTAAHGPLHGGMPNKQAAAAPVPARPAPAAPAAPVRPAPSRPQPALTSLKPPAQAPAAVTVDHLDWVGAAASSGSRRHSQQEQQHGDVQQQLCDLQLSGAQSSSSSLSSSYLSNGNVGAVPRGSIGSSQQALQQNVHAQIRLPPLSAKTAAPLKILTAGLGSLFAGPAGDAGQILQWAPRESGSTLPSGAKQHPQEDHDSAACADLAPQKATTFGDFGTGLGVSKPGKVSCMAVAPCPGWLWCGTSEGMVYCWSIGQSGGVAHLLHSWSAHSGKLKGIAISPGGRLFTGSGNGAVKMWSYGNPAYADPGGPPRLLRQLKKVDGRTSLSLNPHSKVVAVEVSTSGRVLWTVGKNTINLWSAHNGEHLGTLNDTVEDLDQDAFSGRSYASVGNSNDINPKTGLDVGRLNGLFERPAVELLADSEASLESDKDGHVKAMAMSAAVKGVGKASKVLNKFANKIASKLMEEGRQYGGESGDSPRGTYGGQTVASSMSAAAAGRSSTEDKTNRWGSIKHLVAAGDGSMWLSYKRGFLEKYSEGGQLLWSSSGSGASGSFKPAGITSVAVVGSSVWVGDQTGKIWVLDAATGALKRSWKAHVFPVCDLACGGHLVYSLSRDGGIRAWPALQPPQAVVTAWQEDLKQCLQERQLKVLAGTWNVNETKPSRAGLSMWLGQQAKEADVVMIGLQEVEMGTGSVALDVVYQILAKSKLEAGTQAAQAWATAVAEVLGAGNFKRIGLRQMSGILVMVFAKAELEPYIGEVATASVACGVMGYGGNKGAVAISFSIFRRRIVIVSSHFAAHQEKVESRNADYAKIVRHLHFHNVPTDKPQQQQQYEASDVVVAGGSYISSGSNTSSPARGPQQQGSSIQNFLSKQQGTPQQHIYQDFAEDPAVAGASAMYVSSAARGSASAGGRYPSASAASAATAEAAAEDEWGAGMRDAELLVWVGDFNYRVDCPDGFVPDRSDPEKNPISLQLYWFVLDKISAQQHLALLAGDQCIRETSQGRIFHGLAEGPISFMPTYKFEKGKESNKLQLFYDQGEKKRVPAWTDRIFFRGSGPQRSALQANSAEQPADVRVHLPQLQDYNSVMEVNDSDHKPVTAMLNVQLPLYQQQQLRISSLDRLWRVASDSSDKSGQVSAATGSVTLLVEPQNVVLQGTCIPCGIILSNPCRAGGCIFAVLGSGGGALPPWLEVVPAAGVIAAGDSVQLRVQGSKAHWNTFGSSCELAVLACMEGTVASSNWPMASYGDAQRVSVALP